MYDLIISNPPFGNVCKVSKDYIKDKKTLEILNILYKKEKIPIEIAFFIKSINNSKITSFIIPDGVLTNNSEKEFRKYIIEEHHLNSVISLYNNIFNGSTNIKTSLLTILNKREEENYKIFMGLINNKEEIEKMISSYASFIFNKKEEKNNE